MLTVVFKGERIELHEKNGEYIITEPFMRQFHDMPFKYNKDNNTYYYVDHCDNASNIVLFRIIKNKLIILEPPFAKINV